MIISEERISKFLREMQLRARNTSENGIKGTFRRLEVATDMMDLGQLPHGVSTRGVFSTVSAIGRSPTFQGYYGIARKDNGDLIVVFQHEHEAVAFSLTYMMFNASDD